MLLQLISLLTMTKGYAAPEVGEVIPRAEGRCEQLGQTREIVPVLFRLTSFHLVSGGHPAAWRAAEQLCDVAARSESSADFVAGNLAAGATAASLDDSTKPGSSWSQPSAWTKESMIRGS